MPYVQGNVASGTGTSLGVAFLSNNTAGNFLFVGLNAATALGGDAVTDSRNAYTQNNAVVSNTDSGGSPWSAPNCGAGANTVTVTGAGNINRGIAIGEWDGVTSVSPFDKVSSGTGFSTALASGSTPTTTQADELIIGFAAAGNDVNAPYTVGASFTERLDSAGVNRPVYLEDRIVSATGAYSAAATGTSSSNWAMFCITYKLGEPAPRPSFRPIPIRPRLFAPGIAR